MAPNHGVEEPGCERKSKVWRPRHQPNVALGVGRVDWAQFRPSSEQHTLYEHQPQQTCFGEGANERRVLIKYKISVLAQSNTSQWSCGNVAPGVGCDWPAIMVVDDSVAFIGLFVQKAKM